MGEAHLDNKKQIISIYSHIITYGDGATEPLTQQIRNEIEEMWNEPGAFVFMRQNHYQVRFIISAEMKKDISQFEVLQNTDPKNNFFRIEGFVHGNISFVDGIGSNTGFFLLENLYAGSTTAAHEYGHTLGLDHPSDLDYRGQGPPGIMFPRGTLVDAPYQYDPSIPAGQKGGTMHPKFRKVRREDVENLRLEKLFYRSDHAIIGTFTSIYHWPHEKFTA